MAWSTPRTWTTGELVTAAYLNQEIRDNLEAIVPLGPGAWTSYTPSNTNVTLGSGTQVARYTKIGRTITLTYVLVFGTGTSFGGNIGIGAPVAAASVSNAAWLGAAEFFESGTNTRIGRARILTGQSVITLTADSDIGDVNSSRPFSWTIGDALRFTITYEAAS